MGLVLSLTLSHFSGHSTFVWIGQWPIYLSKRNVCKLPMC